MFSKVNSRPGRSAETSDAGGPVSGNSGGGRARPLTTRLVDYDLYSRENILQDFDRIFDSSFSLVWPESDQRFMNRASCCNDTTKKLRPVNVYLPAEDLLFVRGLRWMARQHGRLGACRLRSRGRRGGRAQKRSPRGGQGGRAPGPECHTVSEGGSTGAASRTPGHERDSRQQWKYLARQFKWGAMADGYFGGARARDALRCRFWKMKHGKAAFHRFSRSAAPHELTTPFHDFVAAEERLHEGRNQDLLKEKKGGLSAVFAQQGSADEDADDGDQICIAAPPGSSTEPGLGEPDSVSVAVSSDQTQGPRGGEPKENRAVLGQPGRCGHGNEGGGGSENSSTMQHLL